jgi:hypothetical protein
MLTRRLLVGDSSSAASISLLIIFFGTSARLAWFSIRRRNSVAMLAGPVFKSLASLMGTLSGLKRCASPRANRRSRSRAPSSRRTA